MDFSTLKATVVRLLGDTVISSEGPSGPSGPTITGGTLYPYDLVADSVNAALIAITSRQWKNTFVDVPGDNTVFTADVPSDLLEFEGIYDNYYKQFIPKTQFTVNGTQFNTWVNAWYIYPSGTITFLNAIQAGVRIFYSTYWTVLTNDSDVLETPNFCQNALTYYAASQCALSKSGQTASIRQFNTKVDSGTPDDNPLLQQSMNFLKRYEREMATIPMMMHNDVYNRTGGPH